MANRTYDSRRMPTPIRVLAVGNVYPPHHLGGYEIIWQGVMRQLREAGHRAWTLTTEYRRDDAASEVPEDPDVHRQLEWYWRDHEWRKMTPRARLGLERRNARTFDRHLAELQPDVITWWPLGGMSLGLIERARSAGVPGLFFVLDPWPTYGPQHDLWMRMWRGVGPARVLVERLTGLPTRVDYANAGRWVFCSEAMRESTLATRPTIRPSMILSPGVDNAFLTVPPEDEVPPWAWQLLYIGRVVEQKGVRTVIESLPLLPAAATLRIVGDGDRAYRLELEQLAARLGVRDRVRFESARPRDELIDVYRAADALVFPVLWSEPWGLVPLEAMALGRPVVATGRGGSGEYLDHGVNSLLYPAGDAQALAVALRELAGSPELRAQLRQGGHQTAEQHSEMEFNRQAVSEIETTACDC
jgi:glycogen(starch) synthase